MGLHRRNVYRSSSWCSRATPVLLISCVCGCATTAAARDAEVGEIRGACACCCRWGGDTRSSAAARPLNGEDRGGTGAVSPSIVCPALWLYAVAAAPAAVERCSLPPVFPSPRYSNGDIQVRLWSLRCIYRSRSRRS